MTDPTPSGAKVSASTYLPPDIKAWVAEVADEERRSPSSVIAIAVEEWLKANRPRKKRSR